MIKRMLFFLCLSCLFVSCGDDSDSSGGNGPAGEKASITNFREARKAMIEVGLVLLNAHEDHPGKEKIITPDEWKEMAAKNSEAGSFVAIFDEAEFHFKGGENWRDLYDNKKLLVSLPKYGIKYYGGGTCLPVFEGGDSEDK